MKIVISAALGAVAILASPAGAATLVQYDFTGAPGNQASTAASNVATGLTGNLFTRGAGLTPTGGADSINSNGFTAQATDFLTFGLSITSGYTATVDNILIGTRSSGTGPRNINLQASLDGGAFTTIASLTQIGTADLYSNLTFSTLTAANSIVFRLLAADQTSANNGTVAAGGTFRVENYGSGASNAPVSINGSVSAVPETATWAMMLVGFGVIGASLRRRRPAVLVSFG